MREKVKEALFWAGIAAGFLLGVYMYVQMFMGAALEPGTG